MIFCFVLIQNGGGGGGGGERMNMSKITQIQRIGEKFLFNFNFFFMYPVS